MTREEKSKAITEITDVLSQNEIIYLTDISGLNSIETSNLRRLCFKSGVKLEVMKNTLLEKSENRLAATLSALKAFNSAGTTLSSNIRFIALATRQELVRIHDISGLLSRSSIGKQLLFVYVQTI